MSKYHSKKVVVDGISFDSRKEANRYRELKLLERAGEIMDLKRQVKFVLLPAQYGVVGYKKNGKPIRKCIERECSYFADFTYCDKNGVLVVEDVKSPATRTRDYILKRKMLLYFHMIRIKEV
jgi:hypothetical protein